MVPMGSIWLLRTNIFPYVSTDFQNQTDVLEILLPIVFSIYSLLLVINIQQKHSLQIEDIIQSTLSISKSKGPSETLRDIRTSTYQICRIEENTKRTGKFHK